MFHVIFSAFSHYGKKCYCTHFVINTYIYIYMPIGIRFRFQMHTIVRKCALCDSLPWVQINFFFVWTAQYVLLCTSLLVARNIDDYWFNIMYPLLEVFYCSFYFIYMESDNLLCGSQELFVTNNSTTPYPRFYFWNLWRYYDCSYWFSLLTIVSSYLHIAFNYLIIMV